MKFRVFSKLVEAHLGSFSDVSGVILRAQNFVEDFSVSRNFDLKILKNSRFLMMNNVFFIYAFV